MDQDKPVTDEQSEAMAAEAAAESSVRAAPTTIGGQLRAAREAQGKSLAELAATTKVPVRSLDAIERMAMAELPSGPYAVGFVRTYARAIGLDAEQAVAAMRAARQADTVGTTSAMTYYEPADAARVPPSKLVWLSLGIALVIAAGYGVWRSEIFTGDGTGTPAVAAQSAQPTETTTAPSVAATAEPTVTIPATAPVLISATGPLYFTLEDGNGRAQFDLTLNAGEFYTVKQNQRGLFLRTATPQSLKLVVDGTALPAIGTADAILSGVGLDAPSLSRIASGQWVQPVVPTVPAGPATPAPTR